MSVTVPVWTVADRLRKARVSAGLAQRDLAQLIDYSHGAIAQWESGNRQVRPRVLKLWALATNVPYEWLSYGDSPPTPGGTTSTKWYSARESAA